MSPYVSLLHHSGPSLEPGHCGGPQAPPPALSQVGGQGAAKEIRLVGAGGERRLKDQAAAVGGSQGAEQRPEVCVGGRVKDQLIRAGD